MPTLQPIDPVTGLLIPLGVVAVVCAAFAGLQFYLARRARSFPFRDLIIATASSWAVLAIMLAVQVATRGVRPVPPIEAAATFLAGIGCMVSAVWTAARSAAFLSWQASMEDPSSLWRHGARLERAMKRLAERAGVDLSDFDDEGGDA